MRGLYAIIDDDACRRAQVAPVALSQATLQGGCAVLQLRAKALTDGDYVALSRPLLSLCRARGVPFIVNDRAHLVAELGADGLHIGQQDMAVAEARRRMGKGLLGVSTHSLEQARKADAQGADWVAFGPVFATASKADSQPVVGLSRLQEVCREVSRPVIAIGGITEQSAAEVVAAGAAMVAVISALSASADPTTTTRRLAACLQVHTAGG